MCSSRLHSIHEILHVDMRTSTHAQVTEWLRTYIQKRALTWKDNTRGATTCVQSCSHGHENGTHLKKHLAVCAFSARGRCLFVSAKMEPFHLPPKSVGCVISLRHLHSEMSSRPPNYITQTLLDTVKNGFKKKKELKPYHHAQIQKGQSVNEQLLTWKWCKTKGKHDYKRT